jgi:hypothetical protein
MPAPPPLEPLGMPAEPPEPLDPPDEPPPLAPPPDELLGEPPEEPPLDSSFLQPPTISSALTSDATTTKRVARVSARDADLSGAGVFIAKCLLMQWL